MKKSLGTLSHFYFFLKLLAQILLVHTSSVDDDTLIQEIDIKWREGERGEGGRQGGRKEGTEGGEEGRGREGKRRNRKVHKHQLEKMLCPVQHVLIC